MRSWHDRLKDILVSKHGEELGVEWLEKLGRAFPAAYIEDVSPWVAAFDALAAIAWNPANARSAEARATLLDLLAHPHTALDAAVRIQPAWLADEGLHAALTALDRLDEWWSSQPSTDPDHDSRFGAIRHAVTSLIWLAQDAARSAETHALWGRH